VNLVTNSLVIRIGMHRRHQTLLNAEGLMNGLRQRSQTVGRAARIGYKGHIFGQLLFIHAADNHRLDFIFGGNSQNHFFGAGLNVVAVAAFRRFLSRENAGRFNNNVHPHRLPRQVSRGLNPKNLYTLAVNDNRIIC